MSDRLVLEPVGTTVSTDDDDKLTKAQSAAEDILANNGWELVDKWKIVDNAMYATVEQPLRTKSLDRRSRSATAVLQSPMGRRLTSASEPGWCPCPWGVGTGRARGYSVLSVCSRIAAATSSRAYAMADSPSPIASVCMSSPVCSAARSARLSA
ncbi:hypothetical protein ACNPQM_21295 [Streptomyces sp. NPDC056231]|uniref:hypothetical protein n=1 Tax=Streptomyces sp. NPDC056231 TaxID=3345755 RepID=UPI003AAB7DDB